MALYCLAVAIFAVPFSQHLSFGTVKMYGLGYLVLGALSFGLLLGNVSSSTVPRSLAMARLTVALDKSRSGLVYACLFPVLDSVAISGLMAPSDKERSEIENLDTIPGQQKLQVFIDLSRRYLVFFQVDVLQKLALEFFVGDLLAHLVRHSGIDDKHHRFILSRQGT